MSTKAGMPAAINDAFAPLLGLPSWQVKKGHGSFLTIEFGAPQLIIREPEPFLAEDSPTIRTRKS